MHVPCKLLACAVHVPCMLFAGSDVCCMFHVGFWNFQAIRAKGFLSFGVAWFGICVKVPSARAFES